MTTMNLSTKQGLTTGQWATLGGAAAVLAVIAVLMVQFIALQIWPDAVLFKPLESYPRTALFTIIPAIIATALFAWLTRRRANPVGSFLRIAGIALLLSFIPDYLLPVPYKTLLTSSIAAFMHVVAAAVTVGVLVAGYRRYTGRA